MFFAPNAVEGWTVCSAALAVGFALRWCGSDPLGPWPLAGAVLGAGVVLGLLACWRGKAEYVYASGLTVCMAGSAVWLVEHPGLSLSLLTVIATCLAIAAVVWTLVELLRPGTVPAPEWDERPTHAHVAMGAAAAMLLFAVIMAIAANIAAPAPADIAPALELGQRVDWLAVASIVTALAVSVWDASARFPLLGLYAAAAAAVGLSLLMRRLAGDTFYWSAGLELASFVLAAAGVGSLLLRLRPVARVLRIPDDSSRWLRGWFPTAQGLLATAALAIGIWITLDFRFDAMVHPLWHVLHGRMAGAWAVGCLLPAAALTARLSSGPKRLTWQFATLVLGVLVPSAVGWAWLDASIPLLGLHRAVVLLAAMAAATVGLDLAAPWLLPAKSDWRAAVERIVLAWAHWPRSRPAGLGRRVLLLLPVCGRAAAGEPGDCRGGIGSPGAVRRLHCFCRDIAARPAGPQLAPAAGLRLRSRIAAGRTGSARAADSPLPVPTGAHRKVREFLVMTVAFLWAGLGELFRRRKLDVLAEPLEMTARWLPLLPMLMFLHFGPRTPLVWFLIGLFYSVLAVTRRSVWMGLAAVFTGNMGLWVLWQQHDWGFFVHPQLWLIPLAMAALVAEYFSRDRLADSQSTAVRYLSLSLIYISSSADMFIAGIGNSLWLPLVLLSLSLLGMLTGMALRVRAFLYLGGVHVVGHSNPGQVRVDRFAPDLGVLAVHRGVGSGNHCPICHLRESPQ